MGAFSNQNEHKFPDVIEMLQNDPAEWLREYNESRPNSGKYYYGNSLPLAKEKMLL